MTNPSLDGSQAASQTSSYVCADRTRKSGAQVAASVITTDGHGSARNVTHAFVAKTWPPTSEAT